MAHTKESLKGTINTEWMIPAEIVKNHLTKHFLLYWSTSYFRNQISDVGYISKDGYTFRVVFHTLGMDCYNDPLAQVALSFRVPNPDLNIHPVVLVSCTPHNKGRK